ncbi:XRE family transcriptional regulator [Kribbella catacumbae]|uniref:XRE family transcriptional regulator n=1 Tax=Kribbella catacumbae TaxID=460086 RepID=UPI0003664203|nr:XRE family transcriptional regulator [Kribbella catacumbae]
MEPGAVADLLRRFRARSALTQEALAERAGLSVEAIRMLETGRRRRPRQPTITRLAAALSLSPAEVEAFQQAATGSARATTTDLPFDLEDFTGRSAQVEQLTKVLDEAVGRAVTLSAIGGMGGVGKTVLAVHAARLMADRFPDGRLYLNLRGNGGQAPLTPLEALTVLLQALDVPAGDIPGDLDRASARYRTALAGKRVLVLLDDAADSAQVIPLIPGTAGCSALITSRNRLTNLSGARHLLLEVLSEQESLQLLAEIVGADLVNAEPAAATDLVRRCGCLPLAIRVAGGQLAGGSAADLATLAARLGDDQARLDVLTSPDVSVRSTIAVSIDALAKSKRATDQAAATALPLCSLLDGDSFSLRVAASALNLPLDEAEDVLEKLVDVHLLETPALHRYRLHDLVAEVGRERAYATLTEADRRSAWERVLACYQAMLWRSEELTPVLREYGPGWPDPSWAEPAADQTDLQTVLDWLDVERFALLAAVRKAVAGSPVERLAAVRLVAGMGQLGSARRRWTEWQSALQAVHEIFDEITDPVPKALILADLSNASSGYGDYLPAVGYRERALKYAEAIGNYQLQGSLLVNLSYTLQRVGRPKDGLARAEQALELAKAHAQPGVESAAYLMIGSLAGETGDFTLQTEAFVLAAQPLRTNGLPEHLAYRLRFIAESLRECGRHEEALELIQECVDLYRQLPDRADGRLAEALSDLGAVYQALDRHEDAVTCFQESLPLVVEYEIWDQEVLARTRLGESHTAAGRAAEARTEWKLALSLCEGHDAPSDELRALLGAS